MSHRPIRWTRIAWALGAKLGFALTLASATSFRRSAVEYRILGALPGLEPGAAVTVAGQLVGTVVAVGRRGDTTALRLKFRRGAEGVPAGRTVRLRHMGLDASIVLEVIAELPSERRPHARPFTLGRWLTVGPPDAASAVARRALRGPPPQAPTVTPAEPPVPPPVFRLLPLAPRAPGPMPPART